MQETRGGSWKITAEPSRGGFATAQGWIENGAAVTGDDVGAVALQEVIVQSDLSGVEALRS